MSLPPLPELLVPFWCPCGVYYQALDVLAAVGVKIGQWVREQVQD